MRKNNTKQKIMAAATAVIVAGLGFAGGMLYDQPDTVVEYVNQTAECPAAKIINNTITQTIEVDNGKLDMVLNYLEDKTIANNTLVFEDTRDIVANIEMEDAYETKAIENFKDVFKDYINVTSGYVLSDASLEKIRNSSVKVESYEDKEFVITFEAEVVFENDDSKTTELYDVTYDFDLDVDDIEDIEISAVNQHD